MFLSDHVLYLHDQRHYASACHLVIFSRISISLEEEYVYVSEATLLLRT